MRHLERLYLLANLLVFGAFSAGFLAAPRALAEAIDIHLGSVTAAADLRAMYGGLSLAIAWVFLRALRDEGWRAPAIGLATAASAALALGRTITLVGEGPAGLYIYASLATELAGAALGAWLIAGARAPIARAA